MPLDLERERQLLLALRSSELDPTERGHLDRLLALVDRPGEVWSRDHYEPGHLTASGFVLSSSGDELVLIFHSKLRRWLQPGGHVDPSDGSLEAAARREVLEETDLGDLELLDGPFDIDVHEIPGRGSAPAHLHFDVRFLFRARDDRATSGSDALAARWVRLSEVSEIESDESVMRAVRKLVQRRAKTSVRSEIS